MQDRLYQALDCDQSVLSKLTDWLFQLYPKNSRNNVQETLACNIWLIVLALHSHPSYAVVHTLTQIIFLLNPIHIFVGEKPGAKQWEDLLDHTMSKTHSRKQLWCSDITHPASSALFLKYLGRWKKSLRAEVAVRPIIKVAQHVPLISHFFKKNQTKLTLSVLKIHVQTIICDASWAPE